MKEGWIGQRHYFSEDQGELGDVEGRKGMERKDTFVGLVLFYSPPKTKQPVFLPTPLKRKILFQQLIKNSLKN